MAQLPDLVRSGLRAEDLTELDQKTQRALEPLLRYVNTGFQSLAGAFSKQISISGNLQNEVQTVTLSHGVAQLVSLKKLPQAKGVTARSVGSADGKLQHALSGPVHLTGTTTPNNVKVLANFMDPSAVRVPVTLEFTPEGTYSAVSPTTLQAWIAPTMLNSWVAYGAGALAPGYFKDPNGLIRLRGGIKNGTLTTAAFTLPSGYRPTDGVQCVVRSFSAVPTDVYAVVVIDSSGNVLAGVNGTGSNNFISLDNISFDPR